ncbi:MAG: deoxyhypusine synthase family protein [Patescibacteria group bacterium]
MQRLEPLDLSKHTTIGQLVDGMSRTAFGGRMLGDVSATLTKWVKEPQKPCVIYDGPTVNNRMYEALAYARHHRGWFYAILSSEDYCRYRIAIGDRPVLVVGNYSSYYEELLHEELGPEVIFINSEGRCRPGQIQDGYFPNVIFADPAFIIPLIFRVLDERLKLSVPRTVFQAIEEVANYGDTGQQVRHAVHTWEVMQRDPGCTVFMTLSGAMTVAQLSLLICDMLEKNRVDCIASTGALMAHGLIAGTGLAHYKYDPKFDDGMLAKLGMNRVTDTLEPETNFDHIDEVLNAVLSDLDGKNHSPARLHSEIGKYLAYHPKYGKCRGILKAAYKKGVPVMVPAFHDSELGNDHMTHNMLRALRGKEQFVMNQELDTQKLLKMFTGAKRLGIISIGGGIPRNHIQNLAPLTEIINARKAAKLPVKKFMYGCRIDPQLPWHGGMGGCTYEENMSWRKFFLKATTAQLKMDATIVWPLIQKALDERLAVR